MKYTIEITWSKIMALIVIICAIYLDKINGLFGNITVFTIPFTIIFFTGEQLINPQKDKDDLK